MVPARHVLDILAQQQISHHLFTHNNNITPTTMFSVWIKKKQLDVTFCILYFSSNGDCGSTVVKVLCYKLEGHWFDPSWCQWIFSLT